MSVRRDMRADHGDARILTHPREQRFDRGMCEL